MFGKSYQVVASAPPPQINLAGQNITLPSEAGQSGQQILSMGGEKIVLPKTIDPLTITKIGGISIFAVIAFLLLLDFLILRRRGVFRLSGHHVAHLSFLAIAGASVILSHAGEIL